MHTTGDQANPELAELQRQLVELSERYETLAADHAALRAELGPLPLPSPGPASVESAKPGEPEEALGAERTERPRSRREMLRGAGTAAAGAVVGGAALALTTASPAEAAPGVFTGNPAVNASGYGGSAIAAYSDTGPTIHAYAPANASAIYGQGDTTNGVGVIGFGGTAGVTGSSFAGYGVWAKTGPSSLAQLFLDPAYAGTMPAPPTRTDQHFEGEVVVDGNHDLWLCVVAGTPGTWRRIAGPNTTGSLAVLAHPVRVYDSRPGQPPAIGTKTPLAGGVARSVDLKANASNVPAGATAALVSVVATNTTGPSGGFLAIYRHGIAWPGTSNLNWSGPGQNIAVTTVTAVDGGALVDVYANVPTDVVVDVIGYYR